ncbi:hypothetical protein K438DRAFT_2098551 [Mycena galopus ATCC 62051]|nr:hypothetical protein K438DRAFT_2098551 [Mycena galopus ATCC 62051]
MRIREGPPKDEALISETCLLREGVDERTNKNEGAVVKGGTTRGIPWVPDCQRKPRKERPVKERRLSPPSPRWEEEEPESCQNERLPDFLEKPECATIWLGLGVVTLQHPTQSKYLPCYNADTPPVAALQSDLKRAMSDEFDGHIWEFEPETISQMLSPKRLKAEYFKDLLAIGHKGPSIPASTITFRPFLCTGTCHAGAAELRKSPSFLNDCVREVNAVYDDLVKNHPTIDEFRLKSRDHRWYPQLHFHEYDKPTVDGIDSAAPLKPDLVGLHEGDEHEVISCCWGYPDVNTPQIRIPVEVKKGWWQLLWQAGTYARALRSAAPERAFRLVFGYDQTTCTFRVLIFHNGGIAASLPCDLQSPSDRRKVLAMFWPVFLWQDAEDAGFPSFTDGDRIALHGSEETDCVARRVSILFRSTSCRGRGTLVMKADLSPSTGTAAPSTGLLPETRLDGGRRTRTSTQIATQGSKALKVQREAHLSQKRSPTSGNKLPSGQDKSGKPLSHPGSQPSAAHAPVPPEILPIRSMRYHQEVVAACVPVDFLTLGAARERDLEPLPTSAPTPPDSLMASAIRIVRISSPTASGPGPLTETTMASACSGLFGLPITKTWFQGCFKSGRPVSSSLFEPLENEKDRYHWAMPQDLNLSPMPDHRPMIVCVMQEEGKSLEECLSAEDLCDSILHALLGWLAAYERGWLQRDPSIGNILRLCEDRAQSWGTRTTFPSPIAAAINTDGWTPCPRTTEPPRFNAQLILEPESRAELISLAPAEHETNVAEEASVDAGGGGERGEAWDAEEPTHIESPVSRTAGTRDPQLAANLEKALDDAFGRPRVCKAILTDFDLSAHLLDYFTANHSVRSLSGTDEFMSRGLRAAYDASEPYLQSPLDDLWAFFYTTVWATIFHTRRPHELPISSQEASWRKGTRSRLVTERDGSVAAIVKVRAFQKQFPWMLRAMAPVLADWIAYLDEMDLEWETRLYDASTEDGSPIDLPDFNHLAYTGVQGFVRIFAKHRADLVRADPAILKTEATHPSGEDDDVDPKPVLMSRSVAKH